MESLSQSPTEDGFVQDPYPFYDRARATGPLFHWAEYDLVCATSATTVGAILRDRRFGRELPADRRPPIPDRLAPFYAVEANSMLELEPPRHTRLRGHVLRAFTSRRIAALGPEIASLAHTLIDTFPPGEFDLLDHFARKLPVIVIARLLGVPEDRADDLLGWSNAMVAMYQARRSAAIEAAAVAATEAFTAFLLDHVERRRATPSDDLISHLIAAEEAGDSLSTDELVATAILLLNAGHEATVHTIGNGVKALLETADTAAEAALAPGTIAATTEEILRFDPPLHLFRRHALAEIEIAGHVFAPGDEVGCLLAAANRDPGHWDRPHLFLPGRPARPHLAFGAGIHFCLGAPLARLELATALPVLFARLPGLAIAAPPRYADLYHFHGLDRLAVTA